MTEPNSPYLGGQKDLQTEGQSALSKYRRFTVGNKGLFYWLRYELLTTLLGPVPGALGLVLRKLFWPSLFRSCGRGVVFGRSMTLRHPHKISLGAGVICDDYSVLDAKGPEGSGLWLDDGVLLGRGSTLSCKGGTIRIGEKSNIGPGNTLISETELHFGRFCYTAGHVYMIAGGNHGMDRRDIPMWEQPCISRGGIRIEDDVWVAAQATVLDGVHIGRGTVVGACALVNRSLPEYVVAGGVPARILRER